jgi:formylglycine-generating enzyme required for sulfatase activity
LIGLVPEVVQKENTRLEWARRLWASLKPQQEQLKQAKMELEEAKQATLKFQANLEQSQQEHDRLVKRSHQYEASLAQLQEQLSQTEQELAQLQAERDQLKQQQTLRSVVSPQPPLETEFRRIELKGSLSALLQTFNVEVTTIDEQGQLISDYTHQAEYFSEDLGNSVLLRMVYVPGGRFLMGSPEQEVGRDSHEGPQHWVTLEPFCLSQFPITQSQWRAIALLPQVNRPLNPEPSNFKGAELPVEQVSWHDAVEFYARLTHQTGRAYRLPSEAEWEYACRAGTTTPFHFGTTITTDLANYDGSYMYSAEAEGVYRQCTTAIEIFQVANAFGLSDFHGNVWEWCADSWHEDYQDAPTDGSIWYGGKSDDRRVLRGGAWYCPPNLCRSAQRHWDEANHGGSGTSFRVACSVP